MDEVFGILMALVALFGGLWFLGWCYGDFEARG
jgi:hypothetical protein